jgi:hypothetical protein
VTLAGEGYFRNCHETVIVVTDLTALPPVDICYSLEMAKRTQVILVDDLNGELIPDGSGGTVFFGLDGVEYAIDLTDKNAEKLRSALSAYVSAGSRVGRKTGTRGPRGQAGPSPREIRDWARSNGHKVPDRGRIPDKVRQAFDAR